MVVLCKRLLGIVLGLWIETYVRSANFAFVCVYLYESVSGTWDSKLMLDNNQEKVNLALEETHGV